MADNIYWGPKGEYGPFREQQDGEWAGWPDFGQVLRHFREKAGMSPSKFAELYGERFNKNGKPISRMQVSRMELHSQVPEERGRRKFIADLLAIPPILLGIPTLNTIVIKPQDIVDIKPITLTKVSVDTTKYERDIRTLWSLHSTSQAQTALSQIKSNIYDLESLESKTQGDLLYKIRELLFSHHILSTHITRDQYQFKHSYYHANEAVRVAKSTYDQDLTATSLYTRGVTYLEWGMYGTLTQGTFQIDTDKIERAIRNFEMARDGEENLHPQLLGHIKTHLSRAHTILTLSRGQSIPATAIAMLDSAEDQVDRQNIDDQHHRLLVTGYWHSFTQEGLLGARAVIFNIGKKPGTAQREITNMEKLQQGRLGKDLTRTQTWFDTVRASTFMGLEEFEEAARLTKRALASARDIRSKTNLARIIDLHGQLLQSPYKSSSDIQELEDMIHETNIIL